MKITINWWTMIRALCWFGTAIIQLWSTSSIIYIDAKVVGNVHTEWTRSCTIISCNWGLNESPPPSEKRWGLLHFWLQLRESSMLRKAPTSLSFSLLLKQYLYFLLILRNKMLYQYGITKANFPIKIYTVYYKSIIPWKC